MRLNIGIDLGSDSLKIAFAYSGSKFKFKKGSFRYGKFESDSENIRVALPALAYYDDDKGAWIFGDEVEKKSASSFVKVIKLKSLLSLLIPGGDLDANISNKALYEKGNHFPKFFFPTRRGMDENFQTAVDEGRTFTVEGYTPKKLLEEFFKKYVYKIVKENVELLAVAHEIDVSMSDLRTTVVHPPKVGDAYVAELRRLVGVAFGREPYKALSTVKALALYAFRREMIKAGEEALLFDMGEEDISVAKAFMNGSQVLIEGAEGHNDPLPLGGVDVDDAIAQYIENSISHRVTLGRLLPAEQDPGPEKPIVGKQYLFMKNVKKAKIVLSRPDDEESAFHDGVPIGLHCELYIQRLLTRPQFDACIGISERIVAEAVAAAAPRSSAASTSASAPASTPKPPSGGGKRLGGLRGGTAQGEAPAPAPQAESGGRRLGGLRGSTTQEQAPAPAPESSTGGGRRLGGLRSSGASTPEPDAQSGGSGRRLGGLRGNKGRGAQLADATPELTVSADGMTESTDSIAHRVLAYIEEELNRPTNSNMTSRTPDPNTLERRGYVILSGGLVETHSLLDYLRFHLKKSFPHIDILTFDDEQTEGDRFTILSHEDSAYAPAIGGAIVAMEDYDVKTALSLSYATWGCPVGGNNRNIVHLTFLAERGAALTDAGSEFATEFIMSGNIDGEAIFSCTISQSDIDAGRLDKLGSTYMHGGTKKLIIGSPASKERRNVQSLIHLQTVAGGENGKLMLIYQGKEVQVVGDQRENHFRIRQGIRATKEGRVHPFYEVVGGVMNGHQSSSVSVRFSNGSTAYAPVSAVTVRSNIGDFESSSG